MTAVYKPATAQGPAQNVPVPVLPEKAKEFSKEGLIAFTEYWYSTLGYAFETGDTWGMRYASADGCRAFQDLAQIPYLLYIQDGWIEGDLLDMHSESSTFESDSSGLYQADVLVEGAPMSVHRPDNSSVGTYADSPPVH